MKQTIISPAFRDTLLELWNGDWLAIAREIPDESAHCCVTSPPYWGLRDYKVPGQFGVERTLEEYVEKMVRVFREVRRVLRSDGTLWLSLGDSYNAGRNGGHPGGTNGISRTDIGPRQSGVNEPGLKPKDLCGIPWRVAFALQADGWYLRSDIIWAKPNPMPESVTDRPTKAHEYLFLLAKSERYYYDAEAIREVAETEPHAPGWVSRCAENSSELGSYRPSADGGSCSQYAEPGRVWASGGRRNRRSVWTVPTAPYSEAHFATFPPDLIKPCVLAGCPVGGTVLDPFLGSGTTAMVANQLGRRCVGVELNPRYLELTRQRTQEKGLALA
jgi:DNA modification methylase